MSSKEKTDRRGFLKYVAGGAVVVAAAAAGTYYLTQPTPPPIATTTTQLITTTSTQPIATTAQEKLKVAFAIPGSITDSGWNFASYVAANAIASEQNLDIAISEGVGQVGVDATLRSFAERGYNIIWCDTIGHQDAALRVAPDYPDTYFVVVDAWQFDYKNIVGIMTPLYEGAYLCGILAGGMTKTGHIGFVDGQAFPGTISRTETYRLGAMSVKPNVKVTRAWAGVWDDVTKGREVTLGLIDQGVDAVLFHGDGVTLGGIQACSIKGIYAFGDIADQHALAPKTVVTSNMYVMQSYMRNIIELYRQKKLENKLYFWGMKDGGNDIAPYYYFEDKIPQDIKAKVEKVRADVKSGAQVIPYIPEPGNW